MTGLELSRAYYEAFGRKALEEFPELMPFMAVGLFGPGSECLGYDDQVSRDHDFEPGFCIMLPDESVVDRRSAFLLERAYARLPKEFMGFRRAGIAPVGGSRRGVMRIDDFFRDKVGAPDGVLTLSQWLTLPGLSLLEATNGQVFFDNYGLLTRIRSSLSAYPEDIRLKKLAGHLLLAAQAGQYNYARCLSHGETGAAQLAVMEFVRNAMAALFLLNNTYMPYYKWAFRALRALPRLSLEAELFEYLITTGCDGDAAGEKGDVMESVCADIIDELANQGITKAACGDLEKHAYSVNDGITDPEIRNLHILAAV
ncbi:MAG: DUF4037 domain-containing protein [Oscillospiraceae bacterium]|nr:DUF4037 domain-containing protein [Oscillospiraceae bacterium]